MLVLKLLIVAVCHVGIGFLLYQGRIQNKHSLFHSDFVVFGLPMLLALCAYTFLIRREVISRLSTASPTSIGLALALIPTAISSIVFLYIAFNRYGT